MKISKGFDGMKRTSLIPVLGMFFVLFGSAHAGDIKITIPKRTQATPVQRLNREGVDAIRKHQYDKAKKLFYKAYLFDPGDPFTLNNLGYISELEGQVERAKNFYALASMQTTEAVIDRSSLDHMRGESFQTAVKDIQDKTMQVNRGNVEAVRLLSQGRGPEAELLLQRTLAIDPKNGFTLNNLGVAKEAQGDFQEALRYYTAASQASSDETVVVTLNSSWRGKPVSDMARESAKRLRKRMQTVESPEAQAALLNLRGVSAINRNDWEKARESFRQAYKLDPYSAFSLNNAGFLSEMTGDLETAQQFYRDAQAATRSNSKVGLATRPMAEGMKLTDVADQSEAQVDTAIDTRTAAKRRAGGPIQLKRRDNTPVIEPSTPPPAPSNDQSIPPAAAPDQSTPPATQPPPIQNPPATDQSTPPQR